MSLIKSLISDEYNLQIIYKIPYDAQIYLLWNCSFTDINLYINDI